MVRRRLLIVWICCGLIAIAGNASAGESAKTVIKFATLLPRNSAQVYTTLQKEIARQTAGAVEFKVYYGGVQGDELDVLRKIRYKQLHGGSFTGHGLGEIVPAVRVTELPYLFQNYDEVTYVRSRLEAEMNQRFWEAGYKVLGWYETGFAYVFSKVPIASVEVARQQKWWMWEGDPLQRANFDAMGISPVPLSLTDVMTSLSTRLIDAAAITPFGAVAFRWYTRFNYMGEYPIANGIVGVVVTRDRWDRIAPPHQATIEAFTQKLFTGMVTERRQSNDRSIDALKKAGIEIVPHDMKSEGMRFVIECAEKARYALAGELYSRELLDRTLALLAEYRRLHPNSSVATLE